MSASSFANFRQDSRTTDEEFYSADEFDVEEFLEDSDRAEDDDFDDSGDNDFLHDDINGGREYFQPICGTYSVGTAVSGDGNTTAALSILSSEDSRGGSVDATAPAVETRNSSLLRERKRRIEAEYMNSSNNVQSDCKTPVARNLSFENMRGHFFRNGVQDNQRDNPTDTYHKMNGSTANDQYRTTSSKHSSQDAPPQQPIRNKRGLLQKEEAQESYTSNKHTASAGIPTTSPLPTPSPPYHSTGHIQFGHSDSFTELNDSQFNKSNRSSLIFEAIDEEDGTSTAAASESNFSAPTLSRTVSNPTLSSPGKRNISRDVSFPPTTASVFQPPAFQSPGVSTTRSNQSTTSAQTSKASMSYSYSNHSSGIPHNNSSLTENAFTPPPHTSTNRGRIESLDSILRNSDKYTPQVVLSPGADSALRSESTVHNVSVYDGVEGERKEAFRSRADTDQSSKAFNYDPDGESVDGGIERNESERFEPTVICGITCSVRCTKIMRKIFSLHRISLCIVESAPCFWLWCCDKDELQGGATSDRLVLGRLNMITFFFTFMQVMAAVGLGTVLFWLTGEGPFQTFAPHMWNANGAVFAIGILGAFIMLVCLCTVRIIRQVDLTGAIRYMWIILWLFPAEIFFTITLFDYHRVTEVWVTHWWTTAQLSWFRQQFCLPGTANTLCAVPVDGGPDYVSEEAFCRDNYDSTQCTTIRDNAQDDAVFWLLLFYTAVASWSVVLMFVLILVLNSLERIISKPIVQKSRESNVPGWLTFPTIACALVGVVYFLSPSSALRVLEAEQWVAFLYIIAAGLFLIALIMGGILSVFPIRSDTDKRSKSSVVVVFIVILAVNAALLATIFVASIVWSANLDLTRRDRGDIACVLKGTDCTNCDEFAPGVRCPEWSLDDLYRIVQTQLKQSATLASIFILYAVNVFIYGVVLRRHLANYQIEYV